MIPDITAPSTTSLPGRYLATLQEVYDRFVAHPDFAASTTRAAIWQEWAKATAALNSAVPIACVWLAGSFISTKLDPSDMDCTYWIDADQAAIAHADTNRSQVLGFFAQGRSLKTQLGIPVDNFLLTWRPVVDPVTRTTEDEEYYFVRGHWDDWWQRDRVSAAGAAPTRDDALPRRGYLEVIIDGF